MEKSLLKTINLYLLIFVVFLLSVFDIFRSDKKYSAVTLSENAFLEPALPSGRLPWSVRSIDTQVISKHWPKVTRDSVREQVGLLKDLGVNYIAVDTPYDRLEDLRVWAEEIHRLGINVWFRSHWTGWEGDEGAPNIMSPEEYLEETGKFIVNNPNLFLEGDAFTMAVEAEQVGVGIGRKFLTWDEYRDFLLAEIAVANDAFSEIGLGGKIHTNWLSLNGWVAMNRLTQNLVEKLELIVVDHFVGQSQTFGELEDIDTLVGKTVNDLDEIYTKWKKPILLGEWGYQIYQKVSEERQAEVVNKLFLKLSTKSYLVGVNYWVHMGNSAAIIDDEFGTNLKFRKAADVIRSFYNPLSLPLGIEP